MEAAQKPKYPNLERLIEILEILRGENGCAWDREQTHYSLKKNMIEEAYEAVDAIEDNDLKHLEEELGDVLLQVVLHSQIAKEEKAFDIDDVAKGISDKLVHRHPHVFGNIKVNGTQDILANWDKLKAEEKKHRKSAMDGISKAQSALMSAQKISKNAVKKGFEWPDEQSLWECFESETREFKEAVAKGDKENAEEEIGEQREEDGGELAGPVGRLLRGEPAIHPRKKTKILGRKIIDELAGGRGSEEIGVVRDGGVEKNDHEAVQERKVRQDQNHHEVL